MSRPSNRTRPSLARGLPQTVISRVDFPAPFEPMMVTISPCRISTETPLSASMLP